MTAMIKFADCSRTLPALCLISCTVPYRVGYCLAGLTFYRLSHQRGWGHVRGNEIPYGLGVE